MSQRVCDAMLATKLLRSFGRARGAPLALPDLASETLCRLTSTPIAGLIVLDAEVASSNNHRQSITRSMFDVCPVWAGDYSDGFEPVMEHDPLPEDMGDLLLTADFVSPSGVRLQGCVSAPARHFAAVFVGDAAFSFNAALPPLGSEIADLTRRFPALVGVVFPLGYETRFHFADGVAVVGTFAVQLPAADRT